MPSLDVDTDLITELIEEEVANELARFRTRGHVFTDGTHLPHLDETRRGMAVADKVLSRLQDKLKQDDLEHDRLYRVALDDFWRKGQPWK